MGKSAGLDNIPAALVQAGGEGIIEILTTVCNKIWKTGEWPTTWTQSLVITLPKKGNCMFWAMIEAEGEVGTRKTGLSPPVFLAHLSRRLTRWAYRMGLKPASVRASMRASMRASTLSNMNISETSRPITTQFYLKYHWGGGKAALGFGADQIRTLVFMATDSSHRVIMGKRVSSRFLDWFLLVHFYTCR